MWLVLFVKEGRSETHYIEYYFLINQNVFAFVSTTFFSVFFLETFSTGALGAGGAGVSSLIAPVLCFFFASSYSLMKAANSSSSAFSYLAFLVVGFFFGALPFAAAPLFFVSSYSTSLQSRSWSEKIVRFFFWPFFSSRFLEHPAPSTNLRFFFYYYIIDYYSLW